MSEERTTAKSPYQVLARKYRPKAFSDLVGQEGLIQILNNAIETNRLPHAIILTGVRGVGKTTTARLLARSLNCVGPDGTGSETITPCGTCAPCQALLSESLLDVIEMDAASRTGVDDVREIIEAARYKPLSARYKIYIIDEVHMLSKSAFNALLKTLEEPPTHVKFIFATTEIHKVPETVLSRCMRFDLQRVKMGDLVSLLKSITEKEGFKAEETALTLIARAGNGSARDSLSLLDQALSLSKESMTADNVRAMLHLADQKEILTLLKDIFEGHPQEALNTFNHLYDKGSDPQTLLEQMLNTTHWLQMLQLSTDSLEDSPQNPETNDLAQNLSQSLSVPILARLWQGLIKGHKEVKAAPDPCKAAHMILMRLCYLAELPTPGEILSTYNPSFEKGSPAPLKSAPSSIPSSTTQKISPKPSSAAPDTCEQKGTRPALPPQTTPQKEPLAEPPVSHQGAPPQSSLPATFEDFLALVSHKREPLLAISLKSDIHVLEYKPGFLTLYLTSKASKDLIPTLKKHLKEWTNYDWQITVSKTPGTGSVHSLEEAKAKAKLDTLKEQPLAKAALEIFPEAKIQPLNPS